MKANETITGKSPAIARLCRKKRSTGRGEYGPVEASRLVSSVSGINAESNTAWRRPAAMEKIEKIIDVNASALTNSEGMIFFKGRS